MVLAREILSVSHFQLPFLVHVIFWSFDNEKILYKAGKFCPGVQITWRGEGMDGLKVAKVCRGSHVIGPVSNSGKTGTNPLPRKLHFHEDRRFSFLA